MGACLKRFSSHEDEVVTFEKKKEIENLKTVTKPEKKVYSWEKRKKRNIADF